MGTLIRVNGTKLVNRTEWEYSFTVAALSMMVVSSTVRRMVSVSTSTMTAKATRATSAMVKNMGKVCTRGQMAMFTVGPISMG